MQEAFFETHPSDARYPNSAPSTAPLDRFGDLPLLRLRMEYSVDDPELLPAYLGSSWRGLIGWQMRRLCCPFDQQGQCKACRIGDHCPYFCLYELQSDLPGYQDAPRPYVFRPEQSSNRQRHILHVSLVGKAVRSAPLLWKTAQEASLRGLGREQVRLQVMDWWEDRPGLGWTRLPQRDGFAQIAGEGTIRDFIPSPPPLPWRLTIATPLRLRAKGRNMTAMDWPFLLGSLARRLEMLSIIFHDGKPLGRELWAAVQDGFGDQIKLGEGRFTWKDWSRYSNRQRRKVPMGGLMGETLILDAPPEIWTWLKIAELVHVGKGAGMGLGKIEVSGAV